MKPLFRWLLLGLTGLLVLALVAAGLGWRMLTSPPAHDPLPLAAALIALDAPEGQQLRMSSPSVDDDVLIPRLQTQERRGWCGVASSVTVLDALGSPLAQTALFTPEASAVRSSFQVTTGGMTLDQLAGLLTAHGREVAVHHAADADVETFRAHVRANLDRAGDYVLVNYDRPALDQVGGGHISPLGAYNAEADRILVLDVSTYKYPPVWVETAALFAALNTVDGSSGITRGWLEVR